LVNSYTGFGKLKEVIVGRELSLKRRLADFTFQQFYNEAISEKIYEQLKVNNEIYSVNQDLIDKRNIELDNLALLLESKDIIVHRPKKLEKIISFKTPSFKSELSSASNVRDLSLIYGNKIIETPTYVRNRYFENTLLYDIFDSSYKKGGQWIKAPHTSLIEDRIDLEHWSSKRNYLDFDHSRYDMAIDGAQFLRIGKDCIVNVNSYNHYLGFLWVKSFFPEINFHMISVTDNHIDGAIVALKPGVFLVDPKYKDIKYLLPKKFQKWKFLYPSNLSDNIDVSNLTDIDIRLASSRGMDINVLSIDESSVVVNNRALGVKDILDSNGFNVIETVLDNGEIFAGGIHCSTLDLVRDDYLIDFS
jgi:glycine amidinotransferase